MATVRRSIRGTVGGEGRSAGLTGYLETVLLGRGARVVVAGVEMTEDADARIGGQYPLQPFRSVIRAVGDHDHTRVNGVADPDAATMVDAHPRRARSRVEEGIEDGPVGDGIGAETRPDRTSSFIPSPALARSP